MKIPHAPRSRQSGQAAVEAALTLPLTVFLILGIMQLFLMLQGRVMAEYAAFRAVRSGSVRHGDCEAMTHAAVLALLPTFDSFLGENRHPRRTSPAAKLVDAFRKRRNGTYHPPYDGGYNGPIVWIIRDSPIGVAINEDTEFDEGRPAGFQDALRLETRFVFWFPLRIPFANWVIARMVLAHWGYMDYTAQNPLMVTQKGVWTQSPTMTMTLESAIVDELLLRTGRDEYVMPIHATASIRMMTPIQGRYFLTKNCSPAPETL